jgi:hypothetical protein
MRHDVFRRAYFHYKDAELFHSSSPSHNLETTTEIGGNMLEKCNYPVYNKTSISI